MQVLIDASRAEAREQQGAQQVQITSLHAETRASTARLASVESSVNAGLAAAGLAIAGFHDRVLVAKRTYPSIAEQVFSIPYLSKLSVMSFLWQDEAVALRAASKACRDAVAEHT